ncbi:MAG: hypothetical protein GF317_07240 [Candidatus Lokiarchaeota archaeon]|nr:hypothetical protein [Candidatus Lokiarchaeota archaeon]MBD3199502.1 hypothetical protein [Candidatus Lokiarchaeota archaeon]
MEQSNISNTTEKKVIQIASDMDEYDKRILFVLRNLGPHRFSNLQEKSDMSRSTLSKYIKLHLQKNNIEKRIFQGAPHYFITEKGIEGLNEDYDNREKEIFYINEINDVILKSTELISFYQQIGIEESILFQILRMISKIGDKFFEINQNRELFLALFYIFLNSVLTREYKFEINEFCKHYKVKKLRIDFYVDKIMSSHLGFYMFNRENDVFFFHSEDLLGTSTFRLIGDHLIEEIIHINLKGYRQIYDLDKMAEKIAKKLINMDLIWERIREPFEMLIEKLIIKLAIDMGISKTFLMDLVVQSEKLSKSKEGTNSLINIIQGSEQYEDLNIVSIADTKDREVDEILDKVKGFCPKCGKTILSQDFSKSCARCKNSLDNDIFLKSIDEANNASIRYKQEMLKKEELVICSNPKCEAKVSKDWKECPICHTLIN